MMRYLLTYLMLSLLIAVILYGCSNTITGTPEAAIINAEPVFLYKDAQLRFSIQYPEGWLVVQAEDSDETVHFVNLSPGNSPDRAAVTVTVQDSTQELDVVAHVAEQFIQQQPGITNFALVYQSEVSVNELKGIEHTANYSFFKQPMAQRMVYLAHPKSYTFAITMTAAKEKLPKYADTFGEILESFHGMQ